MDYALSAEAEFLAQQPYDASDPEQVNKARKRAARERKEHLQYIQHIMSTKAGRKWMNAMIEIGKPFMRPTVPGDMLGTYENIGRQEMAKTFILDIEEAAPNEWILMRREARE